MQRASILDRLSSIWQIMQYTNISIWDTEKHYRKVSLHYLGISVGGVCHSYNTLGNEYAQIGGGEVQDLRLII